MLAVPVNSNMEESAITQNYSRISHDVYNGTLPLDDLTAFPHSSAS